MNIYINSGEIRLTVNEDPNRVIVFNPQDISFAERFYGILTDFEKKEVEFKTRSAELSKDSEVDTFGVKKNTAAELALIREICEYMKSQIDIVFGAGTSKAAFGDTNNLDMFEQFFDGVTPYIQQARAKKVGKYTANREQRRAVMK